MAQVLNVTQGHGIRIHDPSPPLEDRAIAFFLHNYVFSVTPEVASHAYLPPLLQRRSRSLLRTVASAAGLAALANSGNVPSWKLQSYKLYGEAIRQLHADIQHPQKVNTDDTLGAMLLMGTFEVRASLVWSLSASNYADVFQVIVSGSLNSVSSLSQHITAAAQWMHMRGPTQFSSDSAPSTGMIMQLLGSIVCIHSQIHHRHTVSCSRIIGYFLQSLTRTITGCVRDLVKLDPRQSTQLQYCVERHW